MLIRLQACQIRMPHRSEKAKDNLSGKFGTAIHEQVTHDAKQFCENVALQVRNSIHEMSIAFKLIPLFCALGKKIALSW